MKVMSVYNMIFRSARIRSLLNMDIGLGNQSEAALFQNACQQRYEHASIYHESGLISNL